MIDTDEITWLSKESEKMDDVELFDWLMKTCISDQIELIISHIKILGDNNLIGYHRKENRVYVMFVSDDDTDNNEIIEITKREDKK